MTRPRGAIPELELKRLRTAAQRKRRATSELRVAVLRALAAGGSVREVANEARLSTRTVQDWKALD